MTSKELKALVKFMRAQGILHYKSGDTELTLSPMALNPKEPKKVRTGIKDVPSDPIGTFKGYTDEEILMWSAPDSGANDPESDEAR